MTNTINETTGFEAKYGEWCDVTLPATVADVLEEDNNGYTMRAIETITKYAAELETLKGGEWHNGADVLGSLMMAIENMTPRYQGE